MRSPEAMAEYILDHLMRHGYLSDPRLIRSSTAMEALYTRNGDGWGL